MSNAVVLHDFNHEIKFKLKFFELIDLINRFGGEVLGWDYGSYIYSKSRNRFCKKEF